jgi:hypothetical protein
MRVYCCCCGRDGPGVYYGLAVLKISYPGTNREICGECVQSILQFNAQMAEKATIQKTQLGGN